MSSTSSALVAPKSGRLRKKILPYLLSLPALLVCMGILIPFLLQSIIQ